MEFFDWNILGTFAGSTLAVALFTQITKNINGINKIPTQVWSYILAVVILVAAQFFTKGLVVSEIGLAFVNAVLVSLAANGGYAAIAKIKDSINAG